MGDGETEDGPLELTASELPTVKAGALQMELLIQNLLENAIRYRKQGSPPKVRIYAEETRSHWVIFVADQGIGIAPEYHTKIFEPFQRLNRKNVPSSGIGLAICHKIVERHGGELRVASSAGEGATFVFSVAKVLRSEI